jgi:hypothetical protein
MRSACAASPEAICASVSDLAPTAPPSSTAAIAKASQPKAARFQCIALKAPARAARFLRGLARALMPPASAVP